MERPHTAFPEGIYFISGSRVKLPIMFTLFKLMCFSFRSSYETDNISGRVGFGKDGKIVFQAPQGPRRRAPLINDADDLLGRTLAPAHAIGLKHADIAGF